MSDAALERSALHQVDQGVRPTLERCNEMGDVLVGVDMGTGSSKAVVTNADGQILATATRLRPSSMSMPWPGWAEHAGRPGGGTWCRWRRAGRPAGRPASPRSASAVSVRHFCCAGMLTIGPVRPAILYGIDMRANGRDRGADRTLWRGRDSGARRHTTDDPGGRAGYTRVRRHEPDVVGGRWPANSTRSP